MSRNLKDLLDFQNFARCIVPVSAYNRCLFELWLAATDPAAEGSVPRNSVLHVVLTFPDLLVVAACQSSKVLYSISYEAGNAMKARESSHIVRIHDKR